GVGSKLAGALLLGSMLHTEHKESDSRNGHAHAQAADERHERAERQEEEPEKPTPPPEHKHDRLIPPSPRPVLLILILVLVLAAIGFFWLNTQLGPTDTLHGSLTAGGQGTNFFHFTLLQGQNTLVQVGIDATQFLLVLSIAVIETL